MKRGRRKTRQSPVNRVAAVGIFCLLLAGVRPVSALDPGDGFTVNTEQLSLPPRSDPDHTKLPSERKGEPGEKAALSVYQVYSMYFGTLVHNSGYVVLGTADNVLQDPNYLIYGGVPQSAQIRLSGDPFVAVSFDITAGSATGFTISNFDTDYGTPPLTGLTLDAAGYLTLRVGARLELFAGSLSPGNGQQIGYTVTTIYE